MVRQLCYNTNKNNIKGGDILLKKNKIEFEGDLMYLHPTNKPDIKFTLNREDYDKIKDFSWALHMKKYLIANKPERYYLHKFLLDIHKDRTKSIIFKDNNLFNFSKNNLTIIPKYSDRNRKGNKIEIHNDILYLYTSDNDKYILDAEDYNKVKLYTWNKDGDGYLKTHKPNIRLTSYLLSNKNKYNDIIFINKDRHDYRKSNLKLNKNKYFKKNKIIEKDDYIVIIPVNSNNEYIFDKEYKDILVIYSWREAKRDDIDIGYLVAKFGSIEVRAHWLVMGQPINNKYVIDHIDRNTLDNRKLNLRIATYGINGQNRKLMSNNSSGFTGVYWKEKINKYEIYIGYKHKNIYLGCSKDIIKAAQTYDKKALELYGEHAGTNLKSGNYEKYYNNLNHKISSN